MLQVWKFVCVFLPSQSDDRRWRACKESVRGLDHTFRRICSNTCVSQCVLVFFIYRDNIALRCYTVNITYPARGIFHSLVLFSISDLDLSCGGRPVVFNPDPVDPKHWTFCMSFLLNTPDYNILISRGLHKLYWVSQITDIQNVQSWGSQRPGPKTTGTDNAMSTYSIKITNGLAPHFIIFHRSGHMTKLDLRLS